MTERGHRRAGSGREGSAADRWPATAQRRPRASQHRIRRVHVRLSEQEFTAIAHAARSLGRTPAGFAAEAALAAACDEPLPRPDLAREALLELMAARAQLRRYGNNLNQAARILNAGGAPPEWLRNAIALTDRVVHSVDRAVQDLFDPASRRE